MAAPDMDVIREIPGYKVILKAVLKSQIQQLVEQLASHTDEESVVLTASISDGSLSHLGSESGKSFLEDHEEMKSQFLGFCLKRHHKKSQDVSGVEVLPQLDMIPSGYQNPSMNMSYTQGMPPQQPPGHRMGVGRMGFGSEHKHRGFRHDPYKSLRGRVRGPKQHPNRSSTAASQSHSESIVKMPVSDISNETKVIKTEPELIDNESSNQSRSDTGASNNSQNSSHSHQPLLQTAESGVDLISVEHPPPVSDSLSMNPNIQTELTERQTLHADLASLVSDQANVSVDDLNSSAISDSSVNVKMEGDGDSDNELQIIGMEPGVDIMPQDNWGQNISMSDVSMDASYDAIGATGSSLDVSTGQSGYRDDSDHLQLQPVSGIDDIEDGQYFPISMKSEEMQMRYKQMEKDLMCIYCDKVLSNYANLRRHMRIHEGIYPYKCNICDKKFSDASNYKKHAVIHFLNNMKQ